MQICPPLSGDDAALPGGAAAAVSDRDAPRRVLFPAGRIPVLDAEHVTAVLTSEDAPVRTSVPA